MDMFDFWTTAITIVVVMGAILTTCAYLIYVERKIAAWVQDRVGPNRVGPAGLLQPLADGLKFLLKEDIIPDRVDKLLYLLAPALAVTLPLLAFAVVPFGPTSDDAHAYQFVIAPGVDMGILFVFAIGSLAVYAITLGGWASNNKYSLLGALRASAQFISYEIPMGMAILGVILFTGSLNLERIIHYQVVHGWNVLYQPLAFLLFMICVFAETNRLPFDLPEAEQELIGGYHTEYSALKFGLFFVGEYTHMVTTSFLLVILFLGGWHFPWITELGPGGTAVKLAVFLAKMGGFILFYMLIRWTLPRFRFDQLLALAWKVMIPLALLHLVAAMVVLEFQLSPWVLLPVSLALLVGAGIVAENWPGTPERVVVVSRGHERVETVVRG
jgi:NADH-quinone oxidoreductase subunit H